MLGLIVFGLISFFRLGISQLPDVDFPVINVQITWTGASPETMESAVVDVVEDAVMSVEGIRDVTSTCQEGLANITIEFEMSRNIDAALQEVDAQLTSIEKQLPPDIDPPVVTKSNPEDQPIVWTVLTGGKSMRERVLFARDHLKDSITTVSGVGNIIYGGYVDPNMRIWLNSDEMNRREITVDDVIGALQTGTILTPSGYMDNGPKETNVRVMSEALTAQDFGNLVIPTRNGQPVWSPIHLRNVGGAEEGLADIRRLSRYDGEPSVGLGVIKQRGSNAVAVAERVKKKIKELDQLLPDGMRLRMVVDSTQFIKDATHELLFTLMLSALLTSFVCWLFLGSLSSAFNVVLAIPTSLIGAFIFIYFCGFTLNSFTLLALSLSIGIVVDDAIMVLENIVRYREMGYSKVKAALVGAREITGAAMAASIAILAIFLPVVFMGGIVGKFFFQFGVAMSVAVSLSLLEALTLAPMRCAQFLEVGHPNALARTVEQMLKVLENWYKRALTWALDFRWTVLAIATLVFVASLFIAKRLNKEMVPSQDISRFLITMYTPLGSSMEFTNKAFLQAEAYFKSRPEIANYFVAIGGFQGGLVNQGNIFVILKDKGQRGVHSPFHHEPTQTDMMTLVRKYLKTIPGVTRVSLMDLSQAGFSAQRGYPITFSVQGPDWDKLADVAHGLMQKMKASGLMTDIDTDYNPNMPEIRIIPDREKAAARGVTIGTIANDISALVGSLQVGQYTDEAGHRDDIRVKLLDKFNRTPSDISKIMVRNIQGEMVPLSSVVAFQNKPSLLTITRYNRERTITLFANVAPGKSQQAAMDFIEKQGKTFPAGYHLVGTGSTQAFKETARNLFLALILGIFVAYMVLGSQFNSFIHPFVILLALPFSVTGAFLALWITGISLNMYSMIGLILLMGIVKKNSILLVDFTNRRRAQGLGVREALLEACPLRLRPILMTSIACVVAAIPEACSLGPGAETIRPMAVVTIGGVLVSTFLTLLVVPCAYSLMSRLENKKHEGEIREAVDSLEIEAAERYQKVAARRSRAADMAT